MQVVFSLIGKFFISTVMAALYAATVELFPTETRAIAMGICSTSGRFGGILAPLLADAVCLLQSYEHRLVSQIPTG